MTKFDRTVRLRTMAMSLRCYRKSCFRHAKSDYIFGSNLGRAEGILAMAFWCELITAKQHEILSKWLATWLEYQK